MGIKCCLYNLFRIAALLLPLVSYTQNDSYVIDGKIAGLYEGERIFLIMHDGKGWDRLSINSTSNKNGTFHLEGIVPNGPRLYMLAFDKHPNKQCILVLNNEKISIKGQNIERLLPGNIREYLTIEGSPSDYGWASLMNSDRLYTQTTAWISRSLIQLKEANESNLRIAEGLVLAKESLNKGLYGVWFASYYEARNPAFPLFLESLGRRYINHASIISTIYDSLDEKTKNSFYGLLLKDMSKLCIGKIFPSFNLKDTSDKFHSLHETTSKNKLTIVHFWASNSLEKNKIQTELKQLFKKYSSVGLGVIGISSDTDIKEFKKSISINKLPWINLCDLKGIEGVVEKVYNEYGKIGAPNTTNVLLDNNGKIVAWNISGIELEWFLWKEFGQ